MCIFYLVINIISCEPELKLFNDISFENQKDGIAVQSLWQ